MGAALCHVVLTRSSPAPWQIVVVCAASWLMQIVAAADPGTEAGWRTFVAQMAADDGDQGGEVSAAARQAYKMVMRWWTDRALPLQALPAPTSFEFQASQGGWWGSGSVAKITIQYS